MQNEDTKEMTVRDRREVVTDVLAQAVLDLILRDGPKPEKRGDEKDGTQGSVRRRR